VKRKRLLFFGYSGGRWPWPVEDSLADERLSEHLEVVVFSSRESSDRHTIYNLDDLLESSFLKAFQKSRSSSFPVAREMIEAQWEFERTKNPFHRSDIDRVACRLRRWCTAADLLYRIIEPDMVILWNGQHGVSMAFRHAADQSGIPVGYAEKGMLPDRVYFDRRGINFGSTLSDIEPDSLKFSTLERRKFLDEISDIDRKGISAWNQPVRRDLSRIKAELGIPPGRRVVFFPGQVGYDSNVLRFSPHFAHTEAVLRWLKGGLCDDQFFILVKPHPLGTDRNEDLNEILGTAGSSVSKINVLDAIHICSLVVTINSTVGFEAVLRGKPVLQLGKSVLSNKGIVGQYQHGKPCMDQVEDTIEWFEKSGNQARSRAEAMAMHLDRNVYCLRDDRDAIRSRVMSMVEPLHKGMRRHPVGDVRFILSRWATRDLQRRMWKDVIEPSGILLLRLRVGLVKALKFFFPRLMGSLRRKLLMRARVESLGKKS
jgi:hypothetical protein